MREIILMPRETVYRPIAISDGETERTPVEITKSIGIIRIPGELPEIGRAIIINRAFYINIPEHGPPGAYTHGGFSFIMHNFMLIAVPACKSHKWGHFKA
jgi:hypothetical protein